MPIYEYRCRKCGEAFSHLHRRLNEAAPACPKCGTPEPRKLLSAFTPAMGVKTSSCSLGRCPSGGSCATGACPLG